MGRDSPAAPRLQNSPTETRLYSFHSGVRSGPAGVPEKYFWIDAGSSSLCVCRIRGLESAGRRVLRGEKSARERTHHFDAAPFLRRAFLTGAQLKRATLGKPKTGSKLSCSHATVLGSVVGLARRRQ